MKKIMLSLSVISAVLVSGVIWLNDVNQPTSPTSSLPFGSHSVLKPKLDPEFKNLSKVEQRRRFTMERARWEFDMLKDPATGQLPPDADTIRAQVISANPRAKNAQKRVESIVPRGPGNFGGRTRALAFDLSDTTGQTMLAGGVSSGLFRTENRGQSWTKVSAQDEMHNVTAIAQDPRNPNIWYYGTGELSGNSASGDGAVYLGDGIWRSEDGGRTWAQIEATRGNSIESRDNVYDYISELAVHPVTSDLYISAPQGIYRLRNSDNTLEFVLSSTLPRYASWDMHDLLIRPDGGEIFVAISEQAGRSAGIYRSTTGDFSSWDRLSGGLDPLPTGWPRESGRIKIALDTVNNQLYALVVNFHFNDCEEEEVLPEAGFFRLDLAANTWTDLTANLPNDGECRSGNNPFAVQGGYDMTLDIAPNNPNRIYVGGVNLHVSDDGFTTNTQTRRIGGYAAANTYGSYDGHHPDLHAVTFDPLNPNIIVTGSDGGIHAGSVENDPMVWDNLNNDYYTYQYYHVAISQRSFDPFVIGGAQDNGTSASFGEGNGLRATDHIEVGGGDGVSVAIGDYVTIDGEDAPVFYLGFQRGPIFRYNGEGFNDIQPTDSTDSIFVTYFHLDQDNTGNLYYASRNRLFYTTEALTVTSDTWLEMTALGTTIGEGVDIRAMATTRGDYTAGNFLFVGTDNGKVFRITDPANPEASGAVLEMTLPTTSGVVSSISLNPEDHNQALVTISNYKTPSVFYSTDAGSDNPTWTLVEGNIEQLSFRASAIINDLDGTVFVVGTNAGLWSTRDLAGANTQWQREGLDTIGSAVVSQLALRPVDNNLLVGTHGNGMFQATFSTDAAQSSEQPNQYHLADIRSGNGASTYVGIVNSGDATAEVEIFAFNNAGQGLGRSAVVTQLGAKASSFRSVESLFPGTAANIAWLQIGSDQTLSVFGETRSNTTRAAYTASVTDQRAYLPHIARDLVNFETVLNVVNPTNAESGVNLTGYPGNQTASIDSAAGAFGYSSQPITDHLGGDLTNFSWAELNATGAGMAAMESFTRLPNRTQTAALGLDQNAGTTLNFLHVATDTNQFWTGMVYINLGDAATDVTETYYNASGEVLKTTERNLTPQQKITLLFDFENQEEVPAGTAWVQVVGAQPLIGYALFGAPSISSNDYFTGLQGNYGGGQRWLYPYFNSTADSFTGLVAVNLGDATANLTFNAYDAAGNLLESRTIDAVSAKTKYVTTLSGLFQNANTLANGAWVEAVADGSSWSGFLLWGDQGVASRQHLAGIKATPLP